MKYRPSPVTARFETWVCECLLAGITGSNPDGDMEISLVNFVCFKVRDRCDRPIIRLEEPY